MTLYDKLKKGISTALLGTAIYASTILPVQAQEVPRQLPPAIEENNNKYELEGYLGFQSYEDLFNGLTEDGKLDCEDVQRLQLFLESITSNFKEKYLGQNSKYHLPANRINILSSDYLVRVEDLKLLQGAVTVKRDYLKKRLHDNSFINEGWIASNQEELDNIKYAFPLTSLSKTGFYARHSDSYKIVPLREEYPTKTKIPFWPGFLWGLTPLIASMIGLYKRKKNTAHLSDFARAPLIHAFGSIVLDGVHPLVYPVRVGGGLTWEGYKMHKYNNANKSQKTIPPPKLTKPSNIDPWCELEDIPKKEEKTVDPWVKLENKLR